MICGIKLAPLILMFILSIPNDCAVSSFLVGNTPNIESLPVYESVQDVSKSLPFGPLLPKKFNVPFAIEVNAPVDACPPSAVKVLLGTKSASRLTYITKFSCLTPLSSILSPFCTLLGSMKIRLFTSTLTNISSFSPNLLFPII